jgi:hypothetical protein
MIASAARPSLGSRVAARFTSPADVALAARIMMWACVMPLLKQTLPLKTLVRLTRRQGNGSSRDLAREDRIVTFARWACRLTRWRSGGNCLERGLIAYRYLSAANARPELVVGVGHGAGGHILGHAWVLVEGEPVGEDRSSLREYAPIVIFDATGQPSASVATPLPTHENDQRLDGRARAFGQD